MIRAGWVITFIGSAIIGVGVISFLYSLWFQPYGGANIGSPFVVAAGLIVLVIGLVLLLVGYQDRKLHRVSQVVPESGQASHQQESTQ